MMYWSDYAEATALADFMIEFDVYGARDAGIDEGEGYDEFCFWVSYTAEDDPEELISQLLDMKEKCEPGDENDREIDHYIVWLETMKEQMEEN